MFSFLIFISFLFLKSVPLSGIICVGGDGIINEVGTLFYLFSDLLPVLLAWLVHLKYRLLSLLLVLSPKRSFIYCLDWKIQNDYPHWKENTV